MMTDKERAKVWKKRCYKLESQNKQLIKALAQMLAQKFDGRTGVMIQSDMKVIAEKALKTHNK